MTTTALKLLDNIVWHALTGSQADRSAGGATARRYAAGYSPIVSFADLGRPDFAALRPHCEPGEHFYCGGWSGPVPAGWTLEADATMLQMVWDAPPPADPPLDTRPLGAAQVEAMLGLVALTRPGPFGPRTVELGDYLGVFDDAGLVAMAGERMHAAPLREVSGVCTHPRAQGRGLARALVERLVRRMLGRGEIPFLHVMTANTGAIRLYEKMGFRRHQEPVVRVVAPAD